MSDIKIVRISTGEELIATVEAIPGPALRLTDVAILIPTQQNSLGLAPFMAYANVDEGLDIPMQFVMFSVTPVEGLKQQYQNMFGKVITQEKKIIV